MKFKKSLSIILSILMILSALVPCWSIIAAEVNKNTVDYFSDSVIDLIDEYDADEEYMEEEDSNQAFIKDRLIVSSDKVSQNYGAIDFVVGLGYTILQYDSEETCKTAKDKLIADGYNAEYDAILSSADVNSTPSTSKTWGNERIESKETLNAIKASGKELSEVTVGVIDSGVDYNHPDLKDRIVSKSLNFSSSGQQNDSMDDQGHGTMVAGIVKQNTTDNVKIKPYKVLNKDGKCATSQIVSVVNYILSEKDAPDVINLSLGGESNADDPFESTQRALIESLVGKGCTVIVAAGNESSDASNYSPSNISSVITVSASNSKNEKSAYSNFGSIVDIAAPGDNIFTTNLGGGYTNSHSGTSFAAPFVTAAAATVLMMDNTLTPTQVESKIKDSAFPIVSNTGTDWCGAGILNYSALYDEILAPAPTFNYESGAYNEVINLETYAEEGYTVKYTTDNSIPSLTNGEIFTDKIIIDDSLSFVAVAINAQGKSKYIPMNYSVVYLADESDFTITDAGIITAYTGTKDSIIVPDTINGIVPTEIGKHAFENSSIKVIELPDSVYEIGFYSFAGCINLQRIKALGATGIDSYTFSNCTSLVDVNAPNVEELGGFTFSGCKRLEKVDFNETLLKSGRQSFAGTGFKYAYFPELWFARELFVNTPLISANLPNVRGLGGTFDNCYALKELYAPNLTDLADSPFNNCSSFLEYDFSYLTEVGDSAFSGSYFTEINLPNCINVGMAAFKNCRAKHISLPKVTRVRLLTFADCTNLETVDIPNLVEYDYDYSGSYAVFRNNFNLKYLYLPNAVYLPAISTISYKTDPNKMQLEFVYAPKAKYITDDTHWEEDKFLGNFNNLKWAYLPSLTEIKSFPDKPDLDCKIYLSESCEFNVDTFYFKPYGYSLTFIAPENSPAQAYANEYGLSFIPTDSRTEDLENPSNVTDLGKSICTSVAGLRFGFSWDKIPEIENLASNIEYGFIYSQKGIEDLSIDTVDNVNVRKQVANKRVTNGNTTSFNLVFADIPNSYIDKTLSARAYVCIDGMYFYSNVLTGSFGEVANLVLNDNEIDEQTKTAVKGILNKEA